MNHKALSNHIIELVTSGIPIEEAIELATSKLVPNKGTSMDEPTRIAYLDSLTSISDLRKAKDILSASKSKMRNNPEAKERYGRLVSYAESRISAQQDKCTTIQELINLGEQDSTIVNQFINSKRHYMEQLRAQVKERNPKLTLSTQKELYNQLPYNVIPEPIYGELSGYGPQYLGLYIKRMENGDQLVWSINRFFNWMEVIKSNKK